MPRKGLSRMPDRKDRREEIQSLSDWFDTGLGQALTDSSLHHLAKVLPCRYHDTAVQMGPGGGDFLTNVDSRLRIYINTHSATEGRSSVVSDWTTVPLGRNSADLFVLVHTLDFTSDPRVVLREAATILAPEGSLVVCGLNPFGIWGLYRLFYGRKERMPWKSNYLPVTRIQDWISLLGLETVGGSMHFYRPPFESTSILSRTAFMETAGSRWWPALSGAYILVARKNNLNVRLVRARKEPVGLRGRKHLQPVAHQSTRIRDGGLM